MDEVSPFWDQEYSFALVNAGLPFGLATRSCATTDQSDTSASKISQSGSHDLYSNLPRLSSPIRIRHWTHLCTPSVCVNTRSELPDITPESSNFSSSGSSITFPDRTCRSICIRPSSAFRTCEARVILSAAL